MKFTAMFCFIVLICVAMGLAAAFVEDVSHRIHCIETGRTCPPKS